MEGASAPFFIRSSEPVTSELSHHFSTQGRACFATNAKSVRHKLTEPSALFPEAIYSVFLLSFRTGVDSLPECCR